MMNIIHKIKKFKFKKVHYFDIAVIAALLIVGSIFIYNRLVKKSIWIDARIFVSDDSLWWEGSPPEYWLLKDLSPGMVSYNSFGEEMAKITNIELFSEGGTYKRAYVDVELNVDYDSKRNTYQYNFRTIETGKPINLNFGSTNVSGLIYMLDSDPEPRFTKTIEVKAYYLEEWHANAFKEGMTMNDSMGNVLAEIKSVRIVPSEERPIRVSGGRVYYDLTTYKDVYATLEIQALQDDDGSYRFVNGAVIKIGEGIWFHFKEAVLQSKVVQIID